jgi:chitinase
MRIALLVMGCALGLSSPAIAAPTRVVLGYSAAWFDSTCPPQAYNYDALTHLARSFLMPRPDGTLDVPPDFFNPAMESLARSHHVKLLMSIGGESETADHWLSVARHPQYLQRFIDRLDQLMAEHHYDGIDIDWEPSALIDEDGLAYTTMLKALRARFPKAVLTTALNAGDYWISHHSWKDVCDSVDYVNVMVYIYSGAWGGQAAYASNLFPPGAYPPEPEYSVDEGMRNLIDHHHVPPAKLLMGVTFWGSQFCVDHVGDSFPKNKPGYSSNLTYGQTMDLLATGRYRQMWDEKAAMPYAERTTSGSVICYEDARSIRLKCQHARKLGCAGVMIWHVGADVYGRHAPLMDAIAESFGASPQVLSADVLPAQIASIKSDLQRLRATAPATIQPDANVEDVRKILGQAWAERQDQAWRAPNASTQP